MDMQLRLVFVLIKTLTNYENSLYGSLENISQLNKVLNFTSKKFFIIINLAIW